MVSGSKAVAMKKIKDLKAEVNDFKDNIEFTENVKEKKTEKR